MLDAAALKPDGHHLDVAHGSGDSLLLVLGRSSSSSSPPTSSRPGYPPQATVTGITSLESHCRRTRERVGALAATGAQDGGSAPAVRLVLGDDASSEKPSSPASFAEAAPAASVAVRIVCGDAVYRPTFPQPSDPTTSPQPAAAAAHPLGPPYAGRYSSIVCLDAAYHFSTRQVFLAQAFDSLAPGGTLALGDILSSASYPSSPPAGWTFHACASPPQAPSKTARVLLPALLPLLSVPQTNLVPLPTLAAQLADLGFERVVLEDVSDGVWPGFARFLRARGGLWAAFARSIEWLGGSGGLRWVVVSARKPVGPRA